MWPRRVVNKRRLSVLTSWFVERIRKFPGDSFLEGQVAQFGKRTPEAGDSWAWLAIDADRKMILSHVVGLRDESTCDRFLTRLNGATTGQHQVTSDRLGLYTYNVPAHLGSRVHFAQLIKSYTSSQTETRYSPATIKQH